METVATIIGLLGVFTVLAAYALVSFGRWRGDDPRYQWLNIVGTLGILVSLIYQYNLPSVVAQCMWILLSVVGLIRIYRGRRHG